MFFPVVTLTNRKMEINVVGITNPLYLCYMISVVQCLFSNQHFANYFYKKYFSFYARMYEDGKKKSLCHQIMHKIAKNMAEAGQNKIDIKDLGSLFESRFTPSEQHDAH